MDPTDFSSIKPVYEINKSNNKESPLFYSTPLPSNEKLINGRDSEYVEQHKIWEKVKVKMNKKYDELEKELGIKLMQKVKLDKDLDDSSPETESASTSLSSSSSMTSLSENNTQVSLNKQADQSSSRLERELKRSQQNLKLKDEEIAKLSRIRGQVETELEDLTISLFEEANKMVRNANVLRAKSERDCKEALMKIDVLQAEVEALKILVITSTPSAPNIHLHPHLDTKNNMKSK